MDLPDWIKGLVVGSSSFDATFEHLKKEWAPDPPPPTVALSEIGRALVEQAGNGLSPEQVAEIFARAETILEQGNESQKDSIATGFLEATAGAVDRAPKQRWVLQHAGRKARDYLKVWNQFCGL